MRGRQPNGLRDPQRSDGWGRRVAQKSAPARRAPGVGGAADAGEPAMPVAVIAERIGWTREMTILRERVGRATPGASTAQATHA